MADRKYRAFVSYRHADNAQDGRRWAEWLHRALERYVVPPDLVGTTNSRGQAIPDSLYPIFRDEDELPASADLAAGIRAALTASSHLIVLCSPRSAVSPWVRKEVREFKELGRCDSIFAVMIAGEPNADEPAKARAGVAGDEECFCEELRYGVARKDGSLDWSVRTEPLAADLRPGGARAEGYVTAEAYREHLTLAGGIESAKIHALTEAYRTRLDLGLLRTIAGLLGVPLGQLTERDAAYRAALAREELARAEAEAARLRKFNRRLKIAATAISALLVAVLALAFVAWRQRDRAIASRNDAEIHRLAAESLTVCTTNPMQGLRLAVQATEHAREYFETPSPRVQQSLARTLTEGRLLRGIDSGLVEPRRFAVSEDGSRAVASSGARLSFLDLVSGENEVLGGDGDPGMTAVAISADGQRVVSAAKDGTVRCWRSDGKPDGPAWKASQGWVTALALSPDGQRLVTAEGDRRVHLRDHAGKELAPPSEPHAAPIRYLTFAGDGRSFAAASGEISGQTARLYSASDNTLRAELDIGGQRPTCLAFTRDSASVLVGGADRVLRFYPVSAPSRPTPRAPDRWIAFDPVKNRETVPEARAASFSSDGLTLAILGTDNVVYFWHRSGRDFILQPSYRLKTHDVAGLGFGSDPLQLHTISQAGLCGFWDLRSLETRTPFAPMQGHIKSLAFSSPTEVVTAAETGFVETWAWPDLRRTGSFRLRPRVRCDLAPSGRWMAAICEEPAFWLVQRSPEGNWMPPVDIKLPTDGRAAALCEPIRRIAVACIRGVALYDFAGAKVWEDADVACALEPAIAFHPEGTQWAHNRNEATTFVVRDAAGRVLAEPGARVVSAPTALAYSPDGRWLAVGYRLGTVEIYRSRALGEPPVAFVAAKSAISCLRFSPDSSSLAVGARDFEISVWQLDGTVRVPSYGAHATSVDGLAFSADGRTLVSGGDDGMIRCWAVDWRDWLDLAHRRLRAAAMDGP